MAKPNFLKGPSLLSPPSLISSITRSSEDPPTNPKRTLYIRHLPQNKTEDELHNLVYQLFSIYGEIQSYSVKKHPSQTKFSAVVCFREEDAAENALDDLTANPMDYGSPEGSLYVTWYLNKVERAHEQKNEDQKPDKSEIGTVVYLRNLKKEVTEEDLRKEFLRFGLIMSVSLKDWYSPYSKRVAKAGYINFATQSFAWKAFSEALNCASIKNMYYSDAEPYINFHKLKESKNDFEGYQQFSDANLNSQKIDKNVPESDHFRSEEKGNRERIDKNSDHQIKQDSSNKLERLKAMLLPLVKNVIGEDGALRVVDRLVNIWGIESERLWRAMANPNEMEEMIYASFDTGKLEEEKRYDIKENDQKREKEEKIEEKTYSSLAIVKRIREVLPSFMRFDLQKQRRILGEALYPLIKELSGDLLAPQITGMLIDLSIFEVEDVLEFVENPDLMQERIFEAIEILSRKGKL